MCGVGPKKNVVKKKTNTKPATKDVTEEGGKKDTTLATSLVRKGKMGGKQNEKNKASHERFQKGEKKRHNASYKSCTEGKRTDIKLAKSLPWIALCCSDWRHKDCNKTCWVSQ